MKQIVIASTILLAALTAAEAKGGQKVFNAPHDYDYSREKKPGYVRDYCVDAVGNHVYCQGSAALSSDGAYVSSWTSK